VLIESLIERLKKTAVSEHSLTEFYVGLLQPGRADPTEDWRSILQEFPFDEWSFDDRFGDNAWRTTMDSLQPVSELLPVEQPGRSAPARSALSFLGLLLLTVNGLSESSYRRSPRPPGSRTPDTADRPAEVTGSGIAPDAAMTHDCVRSCHRLIQDEGIAEAICRAYYPDRPADLEATPDQTAQQTSAAWTKDVVKKGFSFHRHGTTSIIVRGTGTEKDGASRSYALKLILYPYLRIPRIEQATQYYKDRMPKAVAGDVHLPHVWASASSWILMDFVAGSSLSEVYADRPVPRKPRIDLVRLRSYGTAIFDALCQLDCRYNEGNPGPRRVHGDLTPSNIIVSSGSHTPVIHLIDVGRNYLYAHSSISGEEGPDGRYVAPEVKASAPEDSIGNADLFSLGHLLILFGGVGVRTDGTVPDEFYASVPMIARFIEDLIEADPNYRLIVFADDQNQPRYVQLRRQFLGELDAAEAAERSGRAPSDARWLPALIAQLRYRLPDVLRPLGGMPQRLLRIIRSRHPRDEATPSSTVTRSLVAWSWWSATAWALTISIVLTWFVRQLFYRGTWQWGTRSVEIYQKLAAPHNAQVIPIVDSWRQPDYPFPNLAHNWPSLLVGLTYALVGTKYYQNLFASITPLRAGWHARQLTAWAAAAQFFMRLETSVACVLVLPCVLIDPRWWPINTAIGQGIVYLCNLCCFRFALTAITAAREKKLNTVPRDNTSTTGMASFSEWVPSSLFYAAAVAGIGSLIFFGKLHDIWIYALSVSAINFFLFYIIKCSLGAADVRILLTRAMLAAERLRRRAEKDAAAASPAPVTALERPAQTSLV
jgi:serine/threonine protein kinase